VRYERSHGNAHVHVATRKDCLVVSGGLCELDIRKDESLMLAVPLPPGRGDIVEAIPTHKLQLGGQVIRPAVKFPLSY